jgi:SAM-dependent methyltransferase
VSDAYVLDRGVFRPAIGVVHREEEYDSAGFDTLRQMQERHFWYRGRHRFLWSSVRRTLTGGESCLADRRAIDLGGGCGGWIKYLTDRHVRAGELALADSSRLALDYAADLLPDSVQRYQIDLLKLQWRERWDAAFLLDVLEHIPDDRAALREIRESLTPDGVLFITTPALQRFWTYNDELVHHVRRYSKADYRQLARECGYEVVDVRYFQFFLSPLLLASRLFRPPTLSTLSTAQRQALLARTHRIPSPVVNGVLTAAFAAETPLGHWLPFPWGTSVLATLRKS